MHGYYRYNKYSSLIEEMIETSSVKARENIRKLIAEHPSYKDCKESECYVCGMRDCPYDEPLHYHRDDCPCCFWNLFTVEQQIIKEERDAESHSDSGQPEPSGG